jgi:hypothetical protein
MPCSAATGACEAAMLVPQAVHASTAIANWLFLNARIDMTDLLDGRRTPQPHLKVFGLR